jgi:hypothetical protein
MTAIFDLPEILLNIAIHLAPADLARACRVSRGWFVPFASELWRSIQYDNWKDGSLLSAFSRYAVFVRELRCPLLLPPYALGFLFSQFSLFRAPLPWFNQLTLFRAPQLGLRFNQMALIKAPQIGHRFNQLTLFSAPKLDPENVDTIKLILKHNPNIQNLFLPFAFSQEQASRAKDVFKTVTGMKKLNHLVLRGLLVTPGELGSLLDRLPALESLTLQNGGYDNPNMVSFPVGIPDDPVPPLEYPQRGRQLRSLQMDASRHCLAIILEIARHSPLLQRLAWMNMFTMDFTVSPELVSFTQKLGSLCPRLDQLEIDFCYGDREGLECWLSAFPKLRKLHVKDATPMDHNDVLRSLRRHPSCHDSLEEVTVEKSMYREISAIVVSPIIELLRGFPKLRKVRMRQCRIPVSRFVTLRNVYGYIVASQDLEVLEVTMVGPCKSWAPAEVHSEESHAFWATLSGHWATRQYSKVDVNLPDYKLYYAILDELCRLPKLDLSTVQFF